MQELMMNFTEKLNNSDNSSSENDSDIDIDEFSLNGFSKNSSVCEKLCSKSAYILNLSATRDSAPNVAAALSNGSVQVFKFNNGFEDVSTLDHTNDKTVELKFQSDTLLWTATYNGTISLWDLRIPEKPVSVFIDTTDSKKDKDRKFNTFDISHNGKLLCAGTDDFEGDSFLLFWDVRNKNLAGGFWESHTDDITQVRFHPTDSNKMLSGSTDGLINIFDLSQPCEDDALIDTLNTESSIEKLIWANNERKTIIGCITHTSEVQIWKEEDVQPFCNFTRGNLAEKFMSNSEENIYIADIHASEGSCIILGGSGKKCARGLKLEKLLLQPAFGLVNNQQRIRSSFYNENNHLLITGGEAGCLNTWKLAEE